MVEEYGYNVFIRGNKCYRCEYEWKPRDIEIRNRTCPGCNSPYWDVPKRKKKEKKL